MDYYSSVPNVRESQFEDKNGLFIINDIRLYVPPTAISVHKEGLEYSFKSLRTKVSTKIASGNGVFHAQVKITFPKEGILQLHRLICQIRNNPFVTVENKFITDSMNNVYSLKGSEEVKVCPFTVMGLQISNHPSSPGAFLCELDLRKFNPTPYTKVFGFKSDFLVEEYDNVKSRFFAHRVFPNSNGEYGKQGVLVRETQKDQTRTVRSLIERFTSKDLSPVANRLFVKSPTKSNAYKRYSNYLQVKALFEDFGILITDDGKESDPNVVNISISPALKEKLEAGSENIIGLHEVGMNGRFEEEIISLRDKIIDAMFRSSERITIGFKEFKKLSGNSGFLTRFNSSLNYGTRGLNRRDRVQKRKQNYQKIIKAITGDIPDKTKQKSENNVSSKSSFLQVVRESRDITSAKNFKEYGSNLKFHPLVTDGIYKEDGKVISLSKNNEGNMYQRVAIVFAPFDCTVNFVAASTGKFITLLNDTYHLTLRGESLRVPPELINLYKKEYAAEIKKGDILGFLEGDGVLNVNVNNNKSNSYNELKTFYENNKDTTIRINKGSSKESSGTPFILDILVEDIEQIDANEKELNEDGWAYNHSRPGASIVLEKVKEEIFDIALLLDKNNLKDELKLLPRSNAITGCTATLRNLVSSIPILGLEEPTHQFLGSIEPTYQFSVLGVTGEGGVPVGIRYLEHIRNISIFNAKNFNFIPDSHNIVVDCFITKLIGSKKVKDTEIVQNDQTNQIEYKSKHNFSINSMDTFTIEGSPGVSGLNFRVSESKSFYDEEMAAVRTNELNVNPTQEVIRQLAIGASLNSTSASPTLRANKYKASKSEGSYSYLAWETTNFTAKEWYSKATPAGKRAKNKIDPTVDKRAFLWCRDFLEPLLVLIKAKNDNSRFGTNPTIKFKNGGTFDSALNTKRDTRSNHFANVASDIYVPGMNAKHLAALIVWAIDQNYFNLSSLRAKSFYKDESTARDKQLNVGMGIYGSSAYGRSWDDFDVKMNGDDRSTGFVHIDANFFVTDTNKYKPKTIAPGGNPRRWVGDKSSAAFRVKNPTLLNKAQSLREFWFTDVSRIIEDLSLGNLVVEEESIQEDETDSTEPDNTQGNKQENVKNTYTLTKREDVLELIKLKELFGDLNHSIALNEIEVQQYSQLSQRDQAGYQKYKDKDYQFIVIKDNVIASSLKNPQKFNDIKDYLNTNYNLNIQSEKDLIVEFDKENKYRTYNKITIPISREARSYNLQQSERYKELKSISGMLNNFQKLASIVLTETYLYTSSEDEAIKELERIEEELSGLQVVPSMFDIGTNLLVGPTNTSEEITEATNSQESFNQALSGTALVADIGISAVSLYGAVTAVGGAGVVAIGFPFTLLVLGCIGLISLISEWGEEGESLKYQKSRVLAEVTGFKTLYNNYNKLSDKLKERSEVFKRTDADINELSKEDLESEMETVGKYLADARSVGTGIHGYIGMVYSNNSVIKYFAEISKELKVNSTVNQMLNFSETELKNKSELSDSQKIKGVSLVSDELSEYLLRLFAFPYYKDETFLGSDTINPDDGLFSQIFSEGLTVDGRNDSFYWEAENSDYSKILYEDGANIDQKDFLIKYQSRLSKVNDDLRKPGKFSKNYFDSRKESMRRNQDKKLAWLKGLLEEITANYVALSEDVTSKEIKDARDIFKLFENDAYPDIDRPTNPSVTSIKRLLSPGFYYWDSKEASETTIEAINEETKESVKAVIESSIQFQNDLNNGVVSITSSDVVDNVDLKDYTLLKDSSVDTKVFNSNEIQEVSLNAQSNDRTNLSNLRKEIVETGILGSQRGDERQIEESTSANLMASGENAYKNFYRDNDMLQAFPTFRLYIIEEDSSVSDKLLVFDDFYYYNSVIGFQYHESREQSASTATIQLQNISGTLDGSKRLVRRDIDLDAKAKEKELKAAAKDIDSIVIRNGINVQLRAGYKNNTSELDILLSGLVTDVQYTNDNTVCSIVVQSHGVELERNIRGFIAKNNQEVYKNGTAELLTNMVLSEELKHFGRVKKGRIFPPGQSTDSYFVESFEGREDSYYFYSLNKTYLGYVERYSKYVGYALTATVFLTFGKYLFRNQISSFARSQAGQATSRYLDTVTNATKNVFRNGGRVSQIVTGGIRGTYVNTRNLFKGSVLNRRLLELRNTFFKTRPFGVFDENSFKLFLQGAAGNSRYAAYRILGRGRVDAAFNSVFRRGRTVRQIIDSADTRELLALQQAYLVKELGYGGAAALFSEALAPTVYGGWVVNLINPANIVGKAAGITAVSLLATIPIASIGLIADGWSWLSDYKEDLYKLRKRLILSPSDDNIFPPRLESYFKKGEEDGIIWEALTVTLNIFRGNVGYTSLVSNGFDLRRYDFETLIKNEVGKSRRMIRGREIDYLVQNQNFWQILHEMSLRHPGYCYAARPYGQGLEYRVFFGLPNYKHFVKPASSYEAMRLNKILPAIEEARQLTLKEMELLYLEEYRDLKSQQKEDGEIKNILSQVAYNEYKKRTEERFVPFRNYHLVDSSETLIANNVICSSHNCTNKVIVNFSFKGSRGSKEEIESLKTHDSIYTLPMKASKNIPPELERPKVVSSPNINGIGAANRYGISSLLYGMKNMYEGSLLTLGNSKIRPWDVVMLKDRITNMYGPLEVKAVTHTFNHEVGFLTDIEVNAVVSANDFTSIPMIDQAIIYEARKEIFDEFSSRNSMGLTGREENDKQILKERLRKVLSEKLNEMNPDAEFSLSGALTPKVGTNATIDGATAITSLFKSRGADQKQIEKYLDGLTDDLYAIYSDPENRNFYNDVLKEGRVPQELTDGIANLFTLLGASSVLTSAGIAGGTKALNLATGASLRGGYRLALAPFIVGVVVGLGSKTDLFKDSLNGISSYYYNRYLKKNIVRPQILAKATENSLIKIMPLIKDGKPLLAGGIEGVSQDEQWNRVLTNIYNNTSDATEGFMEQKERLEAAGVNVIKRTNFGDYSFVKRSKVTIADSAFKTLLGEEAGNIAIGYTFGEDEE